MGKVLIWFVIIISTVVLYCLMKVKAESDELYEELMRKHLPQWDLKALSDYHKEADDGKKT